MALHNVKTLEKETLREAKSACETAEAFILDMEKGSVESYRKENLKSVVDIYNELSDTAHALLLDNTRELIDELVVYIESLYDSKADPKVYDTLLKFNDLIKTTFDLFEENQSYDYQLNHSKEIALLKSLIPKNKTISPDEFEKVEVFDHKEHNYKVLVIDDEPDIREMIILFLKEFKNFEFFEAGDGNEAFQILKENPIDLIFSDVQMPNCTGVEFVRKAREINKTIPIVIISGESNKDDLMKLINLGVDSFLEKPFQPADLQLKTRNLIKNKTYKTYAKKMANIALKLVTKTLKIQTPEQLKSKESKELSRILKSISQLSRNMNRL